MARRFKFVAATAAASALAVGSVAFAAGGATVTTTPKTVKVGKSVQMLVKGMKPKERIKAFEQAPFGQTRTLFPRAGATGNLLVTVKAQIKGKHTWTFTGRSSHRSVKTSYTVK